MDLPSTCGVNGDGCGDGDGDGGDDGDGVGGDLVSDGGGSGGRSVCSQPSLVTGRPPQRP